jgi:N-methylhydantoinase B
VLAEKNLLPPYGVCGGTSGAPNRFFVVREGQEIEPSPLPGKVSGFPLRAGDLVVMESSGGGGYGDPLERDPAAVTRDVADGVITHSKAETVYGVVFREGDVDQGEIRQRREQLRQARPTLRLHSERALEYKEGHRVCRMSEAGARRLGLQANDIVELVNPKGAPLRAWVEVTRVEGDVGYLSADGLGILGVREGGSVEIRPILRSLSTRPEADEA